MLPSFRGLRAVRAPGSGGEEHVDTTVSTMRPCSRELGAICVPSYHGKGAASAPGAQRSMHGSDVCPVSAIGGVGSSNVGPLAGQMVRKVSGWRSLGLELGTDPYRIPGASVPEEGAGGTPCWGWETVSRLAVELPP